MAHKLLVVTYGKDLPQLEIFLNCIQKNWQGDRYLTVVFGNNTEVHDLEKLIDKYGDPGWNIEIQDGTRASLDGYTEQNLNKIIYSIDQRFQDVIVFDSKDFLIRPMGIDHFRIGDFYRTTFYNAGQKLIELYPDTKKLLDRDISHVPSILNLTPWIWNVSQLEQYWSYMNQRFGDHLTWSSMPAGNEIDSFFAYAWCDARSDIKWLDPDDTPLLVAGGWTHQTYEGMLREAENFDRWPERKIWKHSRKLEDPRCLDVTKSVLAKYGIEKEIIDRFFG